MKGVVDDVHFTFNLITASACRRGCCLNVNQQLVEE